MGAVVTRDDALHQQIKLTHMRMGLGVGANDAEAILRGLPSLPLRYAAHDAATRQIANWLLQRPEFTQVLHPALAQSPGHAYWAQTCSAAGGLVSVILNDRYSREQIDAFIDALKVFKIGYSWGGPVSLAVPYKLKHMRALGSSPPGNLVRFAIGLERVEDLIADFDQALPVLVV